MIKNLKLGYTLANDYNTINSFSFNEFKHSFLHGIGYNCGILINKIKQL